LESPVLVTGFALIEGHQPEDITKPYCPQWFLVGEEIVLGVVVLELFGGHHNEPVGPGDVLIGFLLEESLADDSTDFMVGLAEDLLDLFDDDGTFGFVRETVVMKLVG
jgi:hypothetical protein